MNGFNHIGYREAPSLLRQHGMKHHLQQQIPQLRRKLPRISHLHRVEHLIRLFDQIPSQRLVRLLAIPRAPARRAQLSLQRNQLLEPFTRRFPSTRPNYSAAFGDAPTRVCRPAQSRVALSLRFASSFSRWRHSYLESSRATRQFTVPRPGPQEPIRPLVTLKIFLEKRRNPLHQINPPDGIARWMTAARKQYNFYILAVLNRFIQNQHGIHKVNVVVPGPLPNHQFPFKAAYEVEWRSSPIPLRIILRQAQKSLGRDRIVLKPIRDRRTRKPHLEILRRLKKRMQRHVPAIAPAPDANPFAVHVRQCPQVRHSVPLIRELLHRNVVI